MTLALPALPRGWQRSRIDRVTSVRARIGWKALTAAEYVDDGYAFLATPNIKSDSIDFEQVNYITEFRYEESPELKLAVGDVLLVKDGNTLGITNLVRHLPRPSTVNGSIAVLRPTHIEPRLLRYVLASDLIQGMIGAVRAGMGVPHLFQADIKKFPVPVPVRAEQSRIADYLDAETARIDALIAKKRRMIDLLEVRWLAHARRRLLPSSVATDPLHVTDAEASTATARPLRMSWIASFGTGTTPPTDQPDLYGGDVPWLVTGDLADGPVTCTSHSVTSDAVDSLSALKCHPPGSVVVAMYGATTGRLGLLEIEAATNQACCVITPTAAVRASWLFLYLLAFRAELVDLGRGSGQPNISQDMIRQLRLPVPELEAQRQTEDELRRARSRVRTVSSRLERQIALLQEHRQALITAAVTGEFDIPGVAV